MALSFSALAFPGMVEFQGAAMTGRVAVYTAAALMIPIGWLVSGRRSYPLAAECFLLVPILFDLAGNSFHLYGGIDHYDDSAHLIGLAFSAAFAAQLLRPLVSGRVALAGVGVAGGLLIGIAIELVEYELFSHTQATGLSAYRDTVGDLSMDMLGALLSAAILIALPQHHEI